MFGMLQTQVRERSSESWDQAAQLYLALLALEQAQKDLGIPSDDAARDLLKSLGQKLVFPPGHDSPRGFDSRRSP